MAEQRWLDEVLGASSSSPNENPVPLPSSVRNAPPEMRQAIRRKQNSEVSCSFPINIEVFIKNMR